VLSGSKGYEDMARKATVVVVYMGSKGTNNIDEIH
jgi:hypothetical protein